MRSQITDTLLMIRPAAFGFNAETAASNAFQHNLSISQAEVQQKVLFEFDTFVGKLRSHGIQVEVIEDSPSPPKPDAIFPNNWISFHADGNVFLYPMCTPNRRAERRPEILEQLAQKYNLTTITDLSPAEIENRILEGTGSMVFDHIHRKVYACLSPRTEKSLLEEYAARIGYAPIVFTSLDEKGGEIYHTNVVMCVGKGFVVICLDTIHNPEERKFVAHTLKSDGNTIIDISIPQMNQFAGNMLQVKNTDGDTFLVMSQSASDALTEEQKATLHRHTAILPVSIPTIETIGGGSARCMMAEIFCTKK